MRLTERQSFCLAAIERNGSAHGYAWATVKSLIHHGLIELATSKAPHPRNPKAFWKPTPAGAKLFEPSNERPAE